jgi:hypothetical protein
MEKGGAAPDVLHDPLVIPSRAGGVKDKGLDSHQMVWWQDLQARSEARL